MRLLITGGSGYLGRHLVPAAIAAGHDVCYTFFSQDPRLGGTGRFLDLLDPSTVRTLVNQWRPDAVIHTAGSDRSPHMTAVIVSGTRHLRDAVIPSDARLLHLSTDVLFDGTAAPYREADPPAPRHAYGRAKAQAETIVAAYDNHVIVRTSLIYGLQQMDHGTAGFARALRAGEPLTLFTNQLRNPVWVDALGAALLELADHPYRGLLHVAGAQALSRAEFGLRLLDYWGIMDRATLTLAPDTGDRRPRDCRLVIERARSLLNTPLPGVDEVLAASQSRPNSP